MTKDNMVDRVARAIYPDTFRLHDEFFDWSVYYGNSQDAARRDALVVHPLDEAYAKARAAIKAMREPSEGMLRDGTAKIRYFTAAQGPYPRARAAYSAMIDAALKE